MVRIWYSVCGEGTGHAVRSHTVISELEKHHELLITAADKAYPYLKERHDNVHRLLGNTLVYKNNTLMMTRCVMKFLYNLPKQLLVNTKNILPLLNSFRPDIIISDFESTAPYMARLKNIPCIDIDNIHVQTDCVINKPLYIQALIRFLHPSADHQFIPSFAELKVKNMKKTVIVNPIIREDVQNLMSITGDYVLVYQTSPTNKKILPILEKSGNKYRIYGMTGKGTDKIKFCEFNEYSFLEDLRKCRYVIVNGGFTVISEALHLNKPILSIPIKRQFEQEFNAQCLNSMRLGMYAKQLTSSKLSEFESRLDVYRKNISNLGSWDNQGLFQHLENLIKHYGLHPK